MKTLIIKKNRFQIGLNSFLKSLYLKYCQKLGFETLPTYSNDNLKYKLVSWDPNKKHPGTILFLLIGG